MFKLSTDDRTRGHSMKLYKERWDTAIRGHYFSNRVINIWNSLPEAVIKSQDVTTFKISLDKSWESKPWLCDYEDDN